MTVGESSPRTRSSFKHMSYGIFFEGRETCAAIFGIDYGRREPVPAFFQFPLGPRIAHEDLGTSSRRCSQGNFAEEVASRGRLFSGGGRNHPLAWLWVMYHMWALLTRVWHHPTVNATQTWK
jgi:hypothetical protein